jgi:hypothetical protein
VDTGDGFQLRRVALNTSNKQPSSAKFVLGTLPNDNFERTDQMCFRFNGDTYRRFDGMQVVMNQQANTHFYMDRRMIIMN